MTIQKGAAWGASAPAPHDMVVAESEEAAARAVQQGAKFVCLTSGNLLRALGSGIGDAQLSISFQSGLSLTSAVSTSTPV